MREYDHPAWGRPGKADPNERLKDMDTDGVDAEVLYCEVSAYRFLYRMKDGWREATRAFNDALADFSAVDPKRLVVSYQIPIHDIDAAVAEVQRVAEPGRQVAPAAGLPERARSAGLLRRALRPAVVHDPGRSTCRSAATSASTPASTTWPGGTRRPQRGVMVPMVGLSTAEAFGMWILSGALERFPRLKLVFVEPGVGWVAWYLYIIDDMATRQQYDFPAITSCPASTSTGTST